MNKFSPSFFIGKINIGTVDGASCVNLGNNLPSGFTSFKKHSQGFGTVSGDHADIHDLFASLEERETNDLFKYEIDEDQELEAVHQYVEGVIKNQEVDIKEVRDDELDE
ncbi:hypothetical protein D1B31_07900 [Neobacillus notoginsengisoli]|uniref:Uncharacterized protein n=1 Tax=Neobacillus notoginsengisoli TaxID=1578198 RepID=A0A417YWJ9_9BACI|nr:hypothetical protein [Neobacillus notoginsengisoli]RHW41631.1 hypothetical protein D1B31_07900 [Neobacillus notoginsengisoli]